MKYEMIPSKTVKRLWDAFTDLPMANNEHYMSFRTQNQYWYTDRDRLVGRLLAKYTDRYIVLIDRTILGYTMDGFLSQCDPVSIYDPHPHEYHYGGKPLIATSRKYLHITHFSAVNTMYGSGYIAMATQDHLGQPFPVRLDYETLRQLQFREITKEEFDSISELFSDDREPIPFRVTRIIPFQELKARRLLTKARRSREMLQETVTVQARDPREAYSITENAISVDF